MSCTGVLDYTHINGLNRTWRRGEQWTWRRGVVVITTAQLHSTKPELRFCVGSNPAGSVSEIRDGEDLLQWSRLKIRLNAFRQSTILQKQLIIMINQMSFCKPNHMQKVNVMP